MLRRALLNILHHAKTGKKIMKFELAVLMVDDSAVTCKYESHMSTAEYRAELKCPCCAPLVPCRLQSTLLCLDIESAMRNRRLPSVSLQLPRAKQRRSRTPFSCLVSKTCSGLLPSLYRCVPSPGYSHPPRLHLCGL